jgi:XTP/dITP diphosphohydrolase
MFADDSGLEVLGLEGKPGILSARWAPAQPGKSRDAAAREKILTMLKGKSEKDRDARFRVALVFMVEGVIISAEADCEGKIANAERGSAGFGYDSIFVPKDGDGRTIAEMSLAEKNRFSHRAIAFRELMQKIKEEDIHLVRP